MDNGSSAPNTSFLTRLRSWGRTLALGVILLAPNAKGVLAAPIDNWNVEGAHGEIIVTGSMMEGACSLDASSTWQEISLGNTAMSSLARPGDRGEPVKFALKLRGCVRTEGRSVDRYRGNFVWGNSQPVVRSTFMAVADRDSPSLIKVSGIDGVGIRILDDKGNDIRLGQKGRPIALPVGDSELNYSAVIERTTAKLSPGSYKAVVDFVLSYD